MVQLYLVKASEVVMVRDFAMDKNRFVTLKNQIFVVENRMPLLLFLTVLQPSESIHIEYNVLIFLLVSVESVPFELRVSTK